MLGGMEGTLGMDDDEEDPFGPGTTGMVKAGWVKDGKLS